MHYVKPVLTAVAVLTSGAAIALTAACGPAQTATPAAPSTTTATAPPNVNAHPIKGVNAQPSTPGVSAPSTPPPPAAPAMTVSEQQAVQSAQSYLSMGEGFSYNGLLQQLTSSAGDGFATADAKYAIAHINPNWDAQAVISAKGYLQLGGFSRSSLLQQLDSSAGGGFTVAQAQYAVNQVF